MHFVLIKMSRNPMLLTNKPSKRGDVETLVRSSVSPSAKVNVKFKLTASRCSVFLVPFSNGRHEGTNPSSHVIALPDLEFLNQFRR